MPEFHLIISMAFKSEPAATDEQFEVFLDQVLIEFRNLGRDVRLAASLTDRTADFDAKIEADSANKAETTLMASIETALHAAASHPSGWPEFTAEAIRFECV